MNLVQTHKSTLLMMDPHIFQINLYYRKITSSNMSRLEAHVGFFRLLMKEIFGPDILVSIFEKLSLDSFEALHNV